MLSRREKLWKQPWDDRRFRDHRLKVKSALPAIDDAPPASRPHVTMKLKKYQKENDRKTKIECDNYNLLQRLTAIMKVNRLDNHWRTPLPNLHHKVGVYFPAGANMAAAAPAPAAAPRGNYKCYACELRKRNKRISNQDSRANSLPSI